METLTNAAGEPEALGGGPLGAVLKARVYGIALVAVKEVAAAASDDGEREAISRGLAHAVTVRHENLVHLDGACFRVRSLCGMCIRPVTCWGDGSAVGLKSCVACCGVRMLTVMPGHTDRVSS